MASFLDVCRFSPTLGGTTDWTYSVAVGGYQSPAAAGAVNGAVYRYRAESLDLSQWEVGYGAYSTGTGVLARTTVICNSLGTTAKVSFTIAPQVAIVCLAEDFVSSTQIRGHLAGLTLSTAGSSTTFSVAIGSATDSTNVDFLTLATAISKTTGSWVVGTSNGGLDTGTVAASTWYHAYLIKRPDTFVVDVLFSLSATSPTLPASYTLFRRIGSMKTNGSSQWTSFVQLGDEFLWSLSLGDVAVSTLGTTATLFSLTVPTGLQVQARIRILASNGSSGVSVLVNSPDETAAAANSPSGNITINCGSTALANAAVDYIRTNTSAQIRAVASTASSNFNVATFGWIDTRGRNA